MVANAEKIIQGEVGKRYGLDDLQCNESEACWKFCRIVRERLDLNFPRLLADLDSINRNDDIVKIGDIVLFNVGGVWHCGLCGPDCLHFIHAAPITQDQFQIRQERLTRLPWKLAVYGVYR